MNRFSIGAAAIACAAILAACGGGGGGATTTPSVSAARLAQQSDPLVCFGDSITQGTGATDAAHGWCSLVAAAIGRPSVNIGIGGTSMEHQSGLLCSGIDRWNQDPPPSITAAGCASQTSQLEHSLAFYAHAYPHGVFAIEYGMNDLRVEAGEPSFSPTAFTANTIVVAQGVVAAGIPRSRVLILGVPFSNPERCAPGCSTPIARFNTAKPLYNAALAAAALAAGFPYVETDAAMMNAGGMLLMADDIHPANPGHAVIAAQVLAACVGCAAP